MILPMNLVEAASLSRDTVPGPNAWSVPFVERKAMADKHSKWQSKAWSSSKDHWNEAKSSEKAWKSNCKDARWTEMTRDLEHLQKVIYDKNTTWHKSRKETSRRDNDLFVTMESAAQDEKEEYKHKIAPEQLGQKRRPWRRNSFWRKC